jgi:ABC-type lipoprotein release transport system permease subunit
MITNKPIAALAGYFVGILLAWWMSRKKEMMAGEDVHQEIYRLREDVSSLHYLLVSANGLLTAILAALIF